jgi:signal transduction histidine kinase
MLNYIFLNVSLKWSTIAGSLIVIYYEYVVLFKLDISTSDLIINNFFFLSANFLGVVTKIFLEYSQKREFYTNYQLEKIYNTVQNNNAQLEDIVKKRTEDLKNVNRELENEIKEKEIIEKNLVNSKDKAEKANQLKSEFLAQMSHEIRSPIGVINNFTYLLENLVETKGNDELELCFSGIESASKRIVRTIDLILNTSELQLGTFEPTFRKIDISELLNNIQHEYSIIAEKKNLKIIFIDDSENSLIFADDYALNQIFANLIDNAIKYTREGNITLTLHNNMKDYLTFTITDTGKGMSQEFLTKIFTPFTQEETGYSRKFEGNGLGLSLVKNYSEIINATISVISNQNVGTTFTIIFKNSQD